MVKNSWITHVKAFQAKHGCSYKDAMKHAKSSYGRGVKQSKIGISDTDEVTVTIYGNPDSNTLERTNPDYDEDYIFKITENSLNRIIPLIRRQINDFKGRLSTTEKSTMEARKLRYAITSMEKDLKRLEDYRRYHNFEVDEIQPIGPVFAEPIYENVSNAIPARPIGTAYAVSHGLQTANPLAAEDVPTVQAVAIDPIQARIEYLTQLYREYDRQLIQEGDNGNLQNAMIAILDEIQNMRERQGRGLRKNLKKFRKH
jgi:hypothetical protein